MTKSKPEIFIVESLEFRNEKEELFEGKLLSEILNMHKKKCIYYYIRTKSELKEIIKLFKESNYRYLHFSCHGSKDGMSLTLDRLDFMELGKILNPVLKNKRLFISACDMVNSDLARSIIPQSNCYSIVGPHDEIEFHSSAIFWASFYHLMFKHNELSMEMSEIKEQLKHLTKIYDVPMSYYARSRKRKNGFAKKIIK